MVKTIKYTDPHQGGAPHPHVVDLRRGRVHEGQQGQLGARARGEGKTKGTYTVEMALGALVPKTIVNALVDTSLPKMLEAFKRRAETP